MKLNKKYTKGKTTGILAAMAALLFTACDKEFPNNGLTSELSPSFTISPIAGRTNTYLLKNTTVGALNSRWDYDKGAGYGIGKFADTVFYPDAGVYTVRMQALGKGGIYYTAPTQNITVATSDPNAGNLVQGAKMNAGDAAKWNILNISPGVTVEMKDGKMFATGGGWGHAGFWQKLTVVAGKKYRFGMTVAGSGATDTWSEVYFGTTAPVNGSDYSNGGKQIAMNTWAGCGNVPFSGNIAVIGCDGALAGKNGEISFATGGDIYLVVKTGGANLGTTGISFDNVELRGM